MAGLSEQEVRHHIVIYRRVFGALAVLTVLTVAVSYLRLPFAWAVLIALAIASFKSSLVAGFFMHLVSEKRVIYWILALAGFFFFFLLAVPTIARF